MGHAHEAVEVAKTVLEVAELAWSVVKHLHHHQHNNPNSQFPADEHNYALSGEQLNDIRNENKRMTELLEQNLKLLQNLSSSPCLLNDCPPDWITWFHLSSNSFVIKWSDDNHKNLAELQGDLILVDLLALKLVGRRHLGTAWMTSLYNQAQY